MYTPYIDYDYYVNVYGGTVLTPETAEKFFIEASRIIDSLTYCRVKKIGLDKCSEWEQDIVKECTAEISDFYFTNKEDLTTLLNEYDINGVKMKFGNANGNISIINGITILNSIYAKLSQTRFTNPTLGVFYC